MHRYFFQGPVLLTVALVCGYICTISAESTELAVEPDCVVNVNYEPVFVTSSTNCSVVGYEPLLLNALNLLKPSFYLALLSDAHLIVKPDDDAGKVLVQTTRSSIQVEVKGGKSHHHPVKSVGFDVVSIQSANRTGVNLQAVSRLSTARIAVLIGSIFLLRAAKPLSRSKSFYYPTATLLGVLLLSVLVLYWVMKTAASNRMTAGFFGLATFVGGLFGIESGFNPWTVDIWQELQACITYENPAGFWTLLAVFIVTFIIVYWYGEPSVRAQQTMDMSLTIVACLACFLTIADTVFGVGFVCFAVLAARTTLVSRFVSVIGITKVALRTVKQSPLYYKVYYKLHPQKLLSMKEYEEQGRRETRRALIELRNYYENASRDEKARIRNSLRHNYEFMRFIEDGDDVSPEQEEAYENTVFDMNGHKNDNVDVSIVNDEDDGPINAFSEDDDDDDQEDEVANQLNQTVVPTPKRVIGAIKTTQHKGFRRLSMLKPRDVSSRPSPKRPDLSTARSTHDSPAGLGRILASSSGTPASIGGESPPSMSFLGGSSRPSHSPASAVRLRHNTGGSAKSSPTVFAAANTSRSRGSARWTEQEVADLDKKSLIAACKAGNLKVLPATPRNITYMKKSLVNSPKIGF